MTNETNAIDRTDISSEQRAWKWAVANQGFAGTFAEWVAMESDERASYEAGAAGIPTA